MAKDEGNGAEYDWSQFHGYEVPHYTQVPDSLFDEHLRHLSGAEVKLLLWIVRKTFGYGKRADDISLGQLAKGTGLGISSVKRAVKDLEGKGLILVKRDLCKVGDSAVNTYALRMTDGGRPKMDLPSAQNGPHKIQPLKKQKTTESESPSVVPTAGSDSDFVETIRETATALGCPKDAKQLVTLAQAEGWSGDLIRAAGRVVGEAISSGADIRKPGAYLTTAIRVMLADRRQAADVGEMKVEDRRQDALAYARQVYADKIIGGSWRQVEAILRESYGRDIAAWSVEQLAQS